MDIVEFFQKLPATFAGIRTRIEAGESKLAALEARAAHAEGRLASALDTIGAMTPLFDQLKGIDLGKIATELQAFERLAGLDFDAPQPPADPTPAAPIVAAVQAAVPDAELAHIEAAVDAHTGAVDAGQSHEDAQLAAQVAAGEAGASEEHAEAIAQAIPAPAEAQPAA